MNTASTNLSSEKNKYFNEFVDTMKLFVNELNDDLSLNTNKNYDLSHNIIGIQKFISVFDKLDIEKLIIRFNSLMCDHKNTIDTKNDILFSTKCVVFPGIDLHLFWDKLSPKMKNRTWIFLQILLISSNFIIKYNFNPFDGINSNNSNISLNDLSKENKKSQSVSQMETMAGAMGLENMVDMDAISEQMKNIDQNDITEATKTIQSMLGEDLADENTSNLITDMLADISSELKSNTNVSKNPLESIFSIADTVAKKMTPKINEHGSRLDISKLLNSTQQMAMNCKDDDGNSLFNDKNNPFAILENLSKAQQTGQPIDENTILEQLLSFTK
jgi:hypothetical protein